MSSSSSETRRKRKHDEAESSGSDDDRDSDIHDSDTDSDASHSDEEGSEAPKPPPVNDDEPVLSHAERRRQKKKQNQLATAAAESSSSSPRKKFKLEDGTAADPTPNTKSKTKSKVKASPEDPRRQKRQNSVWVGNLSFRTTPDALRAFFEGAGEITRIHMPMRRGKQQQGENMGFAYVDFATPDAKVVAITLSEGHLGGRNLLVKDGSDFTGRPAKPSASEGTAEEGEEGTTTKLSADGTTRSKTAQKILRNQKQPPAPTLFLGNLGFETTEVSIRELFEAHRYSRHKDKDRGKGVGVGQEGVEEGEGEEKSKDVWIRKIRMGTFEDSGNCKGFAFVDFTSIEHATEALVNPRNHRLNGRDLVVEYASPDAVRRGGGPRIQQSDRKSMSGTVRTAHKGSEGSAYTKRRSQPVVQEAGEEAVEAEAETNKTSRSQRPDRGGHDRSHGHRARPGAALAQAQRQSAAILPGQGQKIVF